MGYETYLLYGKKWWDHPYEKVILIWHLLCSKLNPDTMKKMRELLGSDSNNLII